MFCVKFKVFVFGPAERFVTAVARLSSFPWRHDKIRITFFCRVGKVGFPAVSGEVRLSTCNVLRLFGFLLTSILPRLGRRAIPPSGVMGTRQSAAEQPNPPCSLTCMVPVWRKLAYSPTKTCTYMHLYPGQNLCMVRGVLTTISRAQGLGIGIGPAASTPMPVP